MTAFFLNDSLNTYSDMTFYKYDGAGNDFVVIDARKQPFGLTHESIALLCHRRRGVGADGLLVLASASDNYDFVMRYYNSDGMPADMCGNGGRCIALFAFLQGLGHKVGNRWHLCFLADDGPHEAEIVSWNAATATGVVSLSMRDVPKNGIHETLNGHLLNTGVPHFVSQVEDLMHYDVVGEGRPLRHHPAMGAAGANVDFVETLADDTLLVRTYERGVEGETWACGTGVTACALVTGRQHIHTLGGDFQVAYDQTDEAYTNIRLIGPVSYNFKGEWEVKPKDDR